MPTGEGLEAGWREGKPSACEELSAKLTLRALASFGVEALTACCGTIVDVPPAVSRVVDVGRNSPHLGHDAFSAVRELTLAADAKLSTPPMKACLLNVAECAAKAVYNSTGPSDPFDLETGQRLFVAIAAFGRAAPQSLGDKLWEELFRAYRSASASVGDRESMQIEEWAQRWLIGDAAAMRLLASKVSARGMNQFAASALRLCSATMSTPPAAIGRMLEVCATNVPPVELLGQALTEAELERSQSQPNSPVANLLSVAEQSAKAIAANGSTAADETSGYCLLAALARFVASEPSDSRGSRLGADLALAFRNSVLLAT